MEKIYDTNNPTKNNFFSHISGKTVLDVGCGTGNISKFLIENNNRCFGITFSTAEANIAKRFMEEVIVKDIESMKSLPFALGFFDVIIFADILEHLTNPWATLKRFMPHLRDGGEVIVSVPNIANFKVRLHLLSGKWTYQEYGILDRTHLRFFQLHSARNLIESAGLIIRSEKYSHWNWGFPYIVSRLVNGNEHYLKTLLTRRFPNLLATQFIIYATKGLTHDRPDRIASWHGLRNDRSVDASSRKQA